MSAHADSTFPEIVILDYTQSVGTAARVVSWQAPNFACVFGYMDVAADACDSTDKPTFTLSWSSAAGVVTSSAITTPDVVTRIGAVDSAKSPVIAANAAGTLTVSIAGTAANVLGAHCRVVAYPTDIKRRFTV